VHYQTNHNFSILIAINCEANNQKPLIGPSADTLTFKPVISTFVYKQINKLNIKKATGFDGISAKMIKLAKPVVTGPITSLINKYTWMVLINKCIRISNIFGYIYEKIVKNL
jgi:hypothetical protein